ncbi:hypothetical protein HK101_005844 [Irineochytrium annulatum]|nr:hypothetical protein HK101_005844 [Irineochytrium annulatum]
MPTALVLTTVPKLCMDPPLPPPPFIRGLVGGLRGAPALLMLPVRENRGRNWMEERLAFFLSVNDALLSVLLEASWVRVGRGARSSSSGDGVGSSRRPREATVGVGSCTAVGFVVVIALPPSLRSKLELLLELAELLASRDVEIDGLRRLRLRSKGSGRGDDTAGEAVVAVFVTGEGEEKSKREDDEEGESEGDEKRSPKEADMKLSVSWEMPSDRDVVITAVVVPRETR